MDITDIFEDAAPEISPGAHVPPGLLLQAEATARAYDAALAVKRRYDAAREKLLAELERQLEPLKSEVDTATSDADTSVKELRAAMEAAQISDVPLPDRGSIYIKTIAGRKKNVTKGLLEKLLGEKKADTIWKQVETTPEQRVLVIPPRYEDEPYT